MEVAHPLVSRLEITPEITAGGKAGRNFEAISIEQVDNPLDCMLSSANSP